MTTLRGTVHSLTTIRVPDKAHAAMAPFMLLLVELEDGKRVLGHFGGDAPPEIGAQVSALEQGDQTPIFRAEEGKQ